MTVAIILDPDFGSRLATLDESIPVWLVSSPLNDSAFAGHNRSANSATFTTADPTAAAENLLGIIDDVDLHHGPFSESEPYRSILVIGVKAEQPVLQKLAALGFRFVHDTPDGFLIDLTGHYLNRF